MEKEKIKKMIEMKANERPLMEKINCSIKDAVMGDFDDAYHLGREEGEVLFARKILKYLNE